MYAALALSRRCAITYSETEARIGTTETRYVQVPLPPGAVLKAVEMVTHGGKTRPRRSAMVQTADGPGLEIYVEDCAGQALYYRIRYDLP